MTGPRCPRCGKLLVLTTGLSRMCSSCELRYQRGTLKRPTKQNRAEYYSIIALITLISGIALGLAGFALS